MPAVYREARGKNCLLQFSADFSKRSSCFLPLNLLLLAAQRNGLTQRAQNRFLFLTSNLQKGKMCDFSRCLAFHNGTRKESVALQQGEAHLLEAR